MLFDNIFLAGAPHVDKLSLSRTKFTEMFDHNKLAFILEHEQKIKAGIKRNARDEVELSSYYKKSRNGQINVNYYQPSNKLFGRYQAQKKLSGQGMLREVRHTIFSDYYVDVDIVNAHPVFLLQLCDHLDVDTTYLYEYVHNRDNHMNDLLRANPDLNRDIIKSTFLAIINGGSKDYNNLKVKTEFVTKFKNEMKIITQAMVKHFAPFHKIVKEIKQKKNEDYNIEGATMSHILQYIENQVLMIMFNYIKDRIGDEAYKCILCFDGIMIPKDLFEYDWVEQLEDIFTIEHGIDISLKVKEMNPIDLTPYGYDANTQYATDCSESIISIDSSVIRSITENHSYDRELQLLYSAFLEKEISEYLELYKERIIFTDNELYRFNDVYWQKIDTKYIYELLKVVQTRLREIVQLIELEADDKKKMLSKISKLSKNTFCKSVIDFIKASKSEMYNPFDKNIYLLGFTNGVYDFETNMFRNGRMSDYISMTCGYDYQESTEEDIYVMKEYLRKIMPKEDERDLLLRVLATSLSGISLNHFIVCTGLGSNGKDSLFSYLMKEILGSYYYRCSNTVLQQSASSELNVGLANMNKRRLVLFNEASTKAPLNVPLIKEITGTNAISARGLYSSNTVVNIHQTMFMLVNDKPKLDKVDQAIANRLIVFQFRSLFKSREYLEQNNLQEGDNDIYVGDETIKTNVWLKRYKYALLHLLLQSWKVFQEDGYVIKRVPESIKKENDAYLKESDPIYSWFGTQYKKVDDKKTFIKVKDVYDTFKQSEYWADLTKAARRELTYAAFREYIERSPLLRLTYRERYDHINTDGKETVVRSILLSYT